MNKSKSTHLILCLLFFYINPSTIFAQYNRATSISVLTNNTSRQWQLDTIRKTFGGCLGGMFIITFYKENSAVQMDYCSNGTWRTTNLKWELRPTGKPNEWDVVFSERFLFQHNNETEALDTARLKLFTKAISKRGAKLFLSTTTVTGERVEFKDRIFYSKD